MSNRLRLRKQLEVAWRETLAGPYTSQLINSERGLQVHFCLALMKQFAGADYKRRLFVEPMVQLGSTARCPDLVICNTKCVIGVVEFKYAPKAFAEYSKDLETLSLFVKHSSSIEISNERFRGDGAQKKFQLAEDAILCWAGVYSDRHKERYRNFLPSGGNFLRLDAITHEASIPSIYSS